MVHKPPQLPLVAFYSSWPTVHIGSPTQKFLKDLYTYLSAGAGSVMASPSFPRAQLNSSLLDLL